LKKIIIGFSKPRQFFKPFSWAIRAIERTSYSHVYIKSHSDSLDIDLIYQASGTQTNFMGIQHFKDHAKTLYEFEADILEEKHKEFMRWAIENSGAKYGMKQPLGILLIKVFNLSRNPFDNGRKAWVCSELVGFALEKFLDITIEKESLETIGPKGIFEICLKHFKSIEVT